jgi:hypothetical protein
MRKSIVTLVVAVLPATVAAQNALPPRVPTAVSAIREADLKRDLYVLGGDAMRGREAGTIDEMRATAWTADEMEKIGLKPMGDFGSWFQWWNMRRTRISTISSSVRIGDREWTFWKEITPTSNAAVDVSGPTVFVQNIADTTVDIRGKIAVARMVAPTTNYRSNPNTPFYNYTIAAITATSGPLSRRGAVGVIVIADVRGDSAFEGVGNVRSRGTYDVIGGVPRYSRGGGGGRGNATGTGRGGGGAPQTPPRPVPVLLVRGSSGGALRSDGQIADIRIRSESFEYPSANVIGFVRGTDPALRDEYVLFSSHQDHDGVRYPVEGDSIWNGADDNATTSVALLAIARAWVKQPGKRSALFIMHGAEERGLLGSRYHVAHPVVPLEKIVAVLNGDMLGRNHPDTAALMGSQPPHRNSAELVQMAIDANRATSKFVIDSSWDRPNHPEGWYFRSDHVPYAERSIPSLFFSSNLHTDYHTPRDDPHTIDYAKLTKITKWMYMTGWLAANGKRPAVDPGFVLR